jgi:hypothetical protein
MSNALADKDINNHCAQGKGLRTALNDHNFTQLHTFTANSHRFTFYLPSVSNLLSFKITPLLLQHN